MLKVYKLHVNSGADDRLGHPPTLRDYLTGGFSIIIREASHQSHNNDPEACLLFDGIP
jgi:hypothetical protein